MLPRDPRLLTLPPELRNRIYTYALIEPDEIWITPELLQPSLVRVCRQLRAEALELWLTGNKYQVMVIDCDATLATRWHELCCKLLQSDKKVTTEYKITGLANFNNLKAWLRWRWYCSPHFHTGFMYGLDVSGAPGQIRFMVAAHKVLDLFVGRPWNEFEEALENLRLAVGAYDHAWDG